MIDLHAHDITWNCEVKNNIFYFREWNGHYISHARLMMKDNFLL